ncbi:PQQ-binding-like beta-propeller repeat protein [Natrinema caseinilyticum]|uniref:outer membrane protein assembly factor BamB family protein n=1 Tax=Natrinema caseinilyticum TaxID=2961570 RepID=UPI0020C2E7A7|nr:PQQ-binding-like beta-propeller repeat protein [Natrinema caseinilyticum]
MRGNARRQFLKGCATAAVAGGMFSVSSGAGATTDRRTGTDELRTQPPEMATGWSTNRGDYGRTAAVGSVDGFESGFDFDALETDWTTDVEALPVVADGTAYLSVEGVVHAFDTTDGALEWRSEDIGASGQPTAAYETVYVGGDGIVTALDAATGDVRWQTAVVGADHAAIEALTVAFGMVYALAEGSLTAIDCESGSVEWARESISVSVGGPAGEQSNVNRALQRCVASADGRIFTIAEAGTIAAFDPLTGTSELAIETDYYYLYDLVATDGTVFVRTESEVVAAYDSTTGEREELWHGGVRQVAVSEDTLAFATRYELVAVDLETGDERWTVGKYSHAFGDPVIADDAVLVSLGLQGGRYENSLVAFDVDTGRERWIFSRTKSATVGERCVVADRTVYIDDGGLTAIRTPSRDSENGDDQGDDQTQMCPGENGD